jgi:glycosyltransferase involved in cell wall biosynthesis
MDRLVSREHVVRVIDFEIGWARKPKRELYSRRKVFYNVSKTGKGAGVTVIRPGIVKLPLLDYASILFTHGVEIRRQLVEFQPDVIVGLGILNAFLTLTLAKPRKIPFVYYLIDALHTLIPVKKLRFVGKAFESSALRRCDVVCVINDELKRYSVGMGAQVKKVHVVRAGIDLNRFSLKTSGLEVRKRLGMGKDDVVLFFMGWLYSFSGLKEVASELANVSNKQPRIKLLVVGKGDLYEELQRTRKDFNLDQLVLIGWQPYEKIPEYLAASDICLLPAQKNDIMMNIVPIKMYEYMASGKPVIATRLPGLVREFGFDNGVIYVDGPTEVLKKVTELINSDSDLPEYGKRARDFVRKHSWDKITDEFEKVLKSVAVSS